MLSHSGRQMVVVLPGTVYSVQVYAHIMNPENRTIYGTNERRSARQKNNGLGIHFYASRECCQAVSDVTLCPVLRGW